MAIEYRFGCLGVCTRVGITFSRGKVITCREAFGRGVCADGVQFPYKLCIFAGGEGEEGFGNGLN